MIKFIRKAGRIIPIRMVKPGMTGELEHVSEVVKARALVKSGEKMDLLQGTFWKYTRDRAQKTGAKIAKRISLFKKKGVMP